VSFRSYDKIGDGTHSASFSASQKLTRSVLCYRNRRIITVVHSTVVPSDRTFFFFQKTRFGVLFIFV